MLGELRGTVYVCIAHLNSCVLFNFKYNQTYLMYDEITGVPCGETPGANESGVRAVESEGSIVVLVSVNGRSDLASRIQFNCCAVGPIRLPCNHVSIEHGQSVANSEVIISRNHNYILNSTCSRHPRCQVVGICESLIELSF